MNLTIVTEDKLAIVDGVPQFDLDFSKCNIPSDVHALQWKANVGWIEFVVDHFQVEPQPHPPNEIITELPDWANKCVILHSQKVAEQASLVANARAPLSQPLSVGTQSLSAAAASTTSTSGT